MADKAIVLDNISMEYTKTSEKIDTLKEFFIKSVQQKIKRSTFTALNGIDLEIKKAEKIGIIGPNGAGKSTLLKIISGVIKPTSGKLEVNGSVAPLLELGAGFNPEFSGHDNIFLNGAILGKTKKELLDKYDEIVEFAGLGDFLFSPMKNYSTGMRARLGFSIATQIQPDILLIDEVLGVGDASFRIKSSQKIKEMISGGTTVLIVSHNLPQIKELTDKTLWLKNGEIVRFGPTKEVCNEYSSMMEKRKRKAQKQKTN